MEWDRTNFSIDTHPVEAPLGETRYALVTHLLKKLKQGCWLFYGSTIVTWKGAMSELETWSRIV